jgi:hypothetical protein
LFLFAEGFNTPQLAAGRLIGKGFLLRRGTKPVGNKKISVTCAKLDPQFFHHHAILFKKPKTLRGEYVARGSFDREEEFAGWISIPSGSKNDL